jgi:hypothetical protein
LVAPADEVGRSTGEEVEQCEAEDEGEEHDAADHVLLRPGERERDERDRSGEAQSE